MTTRFIPSFVAGRLEVTNSLNDGDLLIVQEEDTGKEFTYKFTRDPEKADYTYKTLFYKLLCENKKEDE